MATAKKRAGKTPATPWGNPGTAPEDLGPSEQIANQIVSEYRDLMPSVERIMSSGLDDDDRRTAMELFQRSLGTVGDPNRDPRVAIEASRTSPAD